MPFVRGKTQAASTRHRKGRPASRFLVASAVRSGVRSHRDDLQLCGPFRCIVYQRVKLRPSDLDTLPDSVSEVTASTFSCEDSVETVERSYADEKPVRDVHPLRVLGCHSST
jgi:hypothetical protein